MLPLVCIDELTVKACFTVADSDQGSHASNRTTKADCGGVHRQTLCAIHTAIDGDTAGSRQRYGGLQRNIADISPGAG